MKRLLDVNVLLAAIWEEHFHHALVFSWLHQKELVLCPLSELGFLRISTDPRIFKVPMANARSSLVQFCQERNVERIFDDLAPLQSNPLVSCGVTDHYLADLAAKHGMKLATLDRGISHPAVELIA
jgi:predicted nucleic acid-binding protein